MQFQIHNEDTVDEEVRSAEQAALSSGRITPLLKVELWAKIQSRRLSEGKSELQVNFNEPQLTPILSADDKLRQLHRRESNRVAAQKCRRKKKVGKVKLEEIRQELEEKNNNLKETISSLEQQKQEIIQKLYGQPQKQPAMESSNDQMTLQKSRQEDISGTPAVSTAEEDEELRELWYFHSSQEVPTSSSPPPPEPFTIECPPPERATYMTTPILSDNEDMMDDRWLGNSFVNLDKYLL